MVSQIQQLVMLQQDGQSTAPTCCQIAIKFIHLSTEDLNTITNVNVSFKCTHGLYMKLRQEKAILIYFINCQSELIFWHYEITAY